MKKELTALLLASAIALSATACNAPKENGDNNHTTPTSPSITTPIENEKNTDLTTPTEDVTEPGVTTPGAIITEDQAVELARNFWSRFF